MTAAGARLRPAPARAVLAAVLGLAVVLGALGGAPVAAVVRVATAVGLSSGAVDPALATRDGEVRVVVSGATGSGSAAAEAVRAAGGTVHAELQIVDGVSATIDAATAGAVASAPGVRAVTLDRSVEFSSLEYSEATTASNFAKTSGATAAWAGGRYGAGVGVAVIDTGVSSMNDFAGRVVHGPDLSGEGSTIDSYGHGTVMAGVIAGSGADSATNPTGRRSGVAPKATLVAVKVAGRNGATDVSTLLHAMHWVSAYREQFNIRVLNLSWGLPSTQSPDVDPMNYAVQRLWRSGIVVVVAAGNSGPSAGTITKPGDDPLALTVGAFNDKQDVNTSNDVLPDWTSRGPTAHGLAKPDLVAPGRTLVATRSFGSAVEAENPKSLVSPSYIRGSGSSQAAAVTSGLAALLIEARPDLTPDQVKHLLRSTASPIAGAPTTGQGAGRVGLGAALTADPGPAQWQTSTATGLGSLEASRGGYHVETDCGEDGTRDVIQGEIDYRCVPWDGNAWTGNAWTGNAWTGNAWTGNAWTGNAWTGNAWTNASWTGNAWTGGTWTGNAWTGNAWTGNAWTGNAWTGNAWTGSTWTGNAWTGNAWTGNAWTNSEYDTGELDLSIFTTVFYGSKPKSHLRVPGEESERDDWHCAGRKSHTAIRCGL
jgi:serine protease AprX